MRHAVRGFARAATGRARRLAAKRPVRAADFTATYGAVLDGEAFWCAVDVTGAGDASDLALRDPAGRLSRLEAIRVHEAGHDRLEALFDLRHLAVPPGGDVFDVVVTDQVGSPRTVGVGSRTTLREESLPSSDLIWRRGAHRTRKGTLAVEVRPLEVCASVTELSLAPGLVRMAARVVPRGTLDSAARLSLRQRKGSASVSTPVDTSGDDLQVDLPIADLGLEVTSDLETWDVFLVSDTDEIRIGRRLSDLRNPRQAVRYLSTAHSLEDGRRLAVRPYYTNDRFLALEVRSVDRSEPLAEGAFD